jgi:periplasmic protein TonB
MSLEPEEVSEVIAEGGLGSLRGCLVEGDPEQRRRERHIRRRSLAISIAVQSAVLAVLILVPLFGKTERIAYAYATPIPPYSPYRGAPHNPGPQPPRSHGPQTPCRVCAPPNIPPTIVTHDSSISANQTDNMPPDGMGDSVPGAPEGGGLIPLGDSRLRPSPPNHTEHHVTRPQVVHMTSLDPAMLIHRVEPVYPTLARQVHREGRVELRAIIGTDGTIQSLQIVAGDPLFQLSAREAVEQWRYRPTILNGQPVEIDTYITVIYTMQH